jgi:hypothetical protein
LGLRAADLKALLRWVPLVVGANSRLVLAKDADGPLHRAFF